MLLAGCGSGSTDPSGAGGAGVGGKGGSSGGGAGHSASGGAGTDGSGGISGSGGSSGGVATGGSGGISGSGGSSGGAGTGGSGGISGSGGSSGGAGTGGSGGISGSGGSNGIGGVGGSSGSAGTGGSGGHAGSGGSAGAMASGGHSGTGGVAGSGGSGGGAGAGGSAGHAGAGGSSGGAGVGTGGSSGGAGAGGSSGGAGMGGSSGGAAGNASACSGSTADPTAATTISGYLDKLPYDNPTGTERAQVIDAIIRSCYEFGPPSTEAGWQPQYCWAHLVAAIEKESSYGATEDVQDSYSTRTVTVNGASETANDPTIGLLQIRFSSTVHDFEAQGPLDRLSCVGCTFPSTFAAHQSESGNSDFWAVSGPTQNLALMESVACNVGMGAWYYYTYATGNGNPAQVTYLSQYCSGQGTAANLITGLRSHLEGPAAVNGVIADQAALNALQTSDANGYNYVTTIKGWFDTMIGTVSGTQPFFIPLAPNVVQYCGN
jgi:hypothetical protein